MTSLWPVRQLATSTPHYSGWTPSIGPSLPTCPVSSSENIPFLVLSGCIMCPQTAPEVTSALLNGSTGWLSSRMLHSLLMVGCAESPFSKSGFDYPRQSHNSIIAATSAFVCLTLARKRPWLTQNLTNQDVNGSSTLRLECYALGVPRPEITWYKNGVLLKQSPGNLKNPPQDFCCEPFSIIVTLVE